MSYKVKIIYRDVANLKISLNKDGLVTVVSPQKVTKKEIFKILESKKHGLINMLKDYQ